MLLVRRFDGQKAEKGWTRKAMVSALTLLGLDEMMGRYASYQDLAEIIRARFTSPKKTLHEMFGRLVFNVLSGNTDDHARNHAAFWDGRALTLTPAYDICPQNRTGREANQAMLITGEKRMSTLAVCIEAAPQFLLNVKSAIEIVEARIEGIRAHSAEVTEEASLSRGREGRALAPPLSQSLFVRRGAGRHIGYGYGIDNEPANLKLYKPRNLIRQSAYG